MTKQIKNSLSSQDINAVHEDQYGNIWLATTNGLIKVLLKEKGLEFKAFDERNGLANNMIYGDFGGQKSTLDEYGIKDSRCLI